MSPRYACILLYVLGQHLKQSFYMRGSLDSRYHHLEDFLYFPAWKLITLAETTNDFLHLHTQFRIAIQPFFIMSPYFNSPHSAYEHLMLWRICLIQHSITIVQSRPLTNIF